jgi:hypothetical protein
MNGGYIAWRAKSRGEELRETDLEVVLQKVRELWVEKPGKCANTTPGKWTREVGNGIKRDRSSAFRVNMIPSEEHLDNFTETDSGSRVIISQTSSDTAAEGQWHRRETDQAGLALYGSLAKTFHLKRMLTPKSRF